MQIIGCILTNFKLRPVFCPLYGLDGLDETGRTGRNWTKLDEIGRTGRNWTKLDGLDETGRTGRTGRNWTRRQSGCVGTAPLCRPPRQKVMLLAGGTGLLERWQTPPQPLFQRQWAAPQQCSSELGIVFGLHHWSPLGKGRGGMVAPTGPPTTDGGGSPRNKNHKAIHRPEGAAEGAPIFSL